MPRCPRCCPIPVRNKYTKNLGVKIMSCGCLSCPVCGPIQRQAWKDHLNYCMGKCHEIYMAEVDLKDWPKIYKRLNRSRASYWKIYSKSRGTYLVASTVEFEGSVLSDLPVASARMGETMDALEKHAGVQAVSTSRKWKRIPRDESYWEAIRNIDGSVMQASLKGFEEACHEYEVVIIKDRIDDFMLAETKDIPLEVQAELLQRAVYFSRKLWWEKFSNNTVASDYRSSDSAKNLSSWYHEDIEQRLMTSG